MSNFFQFIIYGHSIGKAETQPTDQVLPPVLQHCLANINRQGWVYFCGEFFSPLHFFKFFIAMLHNIFHLNSYRPNKGMAKTQHTEGVWSPALHHHLANINGQQRVYFEG